MALVTIVLSLGASPKPALRPLDLDPLTLRGTSFKPGERVKLLLSAPPVFRTKAVRAGELDQIPPEEPQPPMTSGQWQARKLCSDGGCTGVIGEDGKCSVCGRAA